MYYPISLPDQEECYHCLASQGTFSAIVSREEKIQILTTPNLSTLSCSPISPVHFELMTEEEVQTHKKYAPSSPTSSPEPEPLQGFQLNVKGQDDYIPFEIPQETGRKTVATWMKYEGGKNPRIIGTMCPTTPQYAEPLRFPSPPPSSTTALKDDEVNALLFDSLVESKVDEALRDVGDLVLKAEIE